MLPRIPVALAAALASTLYFTACATPSDLDLTLQHPSPQGKFVVRMEPPAAGAGHQPDARLAGSPERARRQPGVAGEAVAFDGGMPQHGHGFPTRPRVTREVAPASTPSRA